MHLAFQQIRLLLQVRLTPVGSRHLVTGAKHFDDAHEPRAAFAAYIDLQERLPVFHERHGDDEGFCAYLRQQGRTAPVSVATTDAVPAALHVDVRLYTSFRGFHPGALTTLGVVRLGQTR